MTTRIPDSWRDEHGNLKSFSQRQAERKAAARLAQHEAKVREVHPDPETVNPYSGRLEQLESDLRLINPQSAEADRLRDRIKMLLPKSQTWQQQRERQLRQAEFEQSPEHQLVREYASNLENFRDFWPHANEKDVAALKAIAETEFQTPEQQWSAFKERMSEIERNELIVSQQKSNQLDSEIAAKEKERAEQKMRELEISKRRERLEGGDE